MLAFLIGSDLPLRTIDEMRRMAVGLSGVFEKPEYEDRVVPRSNGVTERFSPK